MPSAPPQRPPTFQVASPSDDHNGDHFALRQESVLMPGEVRTPAVRPTPLVGDWTRGDSTVWDTRDDSSQPACTPLNSYGREDDLWRMPAEDRETPLSNTQPGAVTDDDDVDAVRHTIHQALAASQEAAHHHHHSDSNPFGAMSTRMPSATAYTAQSQSYARQPNASSADVADTPDVYAGYTVSSGNTFTVQHATDPRSIRGEVSLSREVSAQELGSRQSSTDSNSLLAKFRSQSEILSDELYFQAKTFPPPPPSNAPMETRRVRAELWYLIARKWDITQQMAPPPRSPLPGMEEEHRLRLQELTRVPYRGDRWLVQSYHWFACVQNGFDYPQSNVANVLPTSFVLQMCA
jgi:hypothetical protein